MPWLVQRVGAGAACVALLLHGLAAQHVLAHDTMFAPPRSLPLPAEERQVDQADVVPGDCVRLTAGEMLPGDVRIVQARDLHIA